MENIITTCCPSVNDLIEIYYPNLVQYMAPVVSPMIAHGKIIKEELGRDVKVVFLGPCIAKKREAVDDPRVEGYIDAVINFTELEEWLSEKNIDIMECDEVEPHNPDPRVNRLYPISSGVLSAVIATNNKTDKYRKFYVHGIKNCIELFESMSKGEVSDCFIEVNTCSGGCIKGSAVERDFISRFKVKLDMEDAIKKEAAYLTEYKEDLENISLNKVFVDRSPNEEIPSEEIIRKILKKTGKTEKQHELNCGACGYSSCREKAIAVFRGKAELTMCIPYMHEKATSMSNIVLSTSPNIILIVDREMKIAEFNSSAEKAFKKSKLEAKEMYLYEFIDHSDFEYVLETHTSILGKKIELTEWNLTVKVNIVYVKEIDGVLGIFQDISEEEEKIKQDYKIKVETIEIAQRVIDKQMMVAQQIAGLLGETTAETKVTLTRMRDTILFDGEAVKKK
ncbi:MAG: putative sensor protein [Clostridiales bacterium]|nr:putative sensor protein [Clostridiales bacterium]